MIKPAFLNKNENLFCLEIPREGRTHEEFDIQWVHTVNYEDLVNRTRGSRSAPVAKLLSTNQETKEIFYADFLDSRIEYKFGKEVAAYSITEDELVNIVKGHIKISFEKPKYTGVKDTVGTMFIVAIDEIDNLTVENVDLVAEFYRGDREHGKLPSGKVKTIIPTLVNLISKEDSDLIKEQLLASIKKEKE